VSKTTTTIEIDKDLWAKVRQLAYDKNQKISEAVEDLLKKALEEAI